MLCIEVVKLLDANFTFSERWARITQMLRRPLAPVFAFVIIRTHEKMGGAERWTRSIGQYEQILAVIRKDDPERAVADVVSILSYRSTDIDELTRKKSREAEPLWCGRDRGRNGQASIRLTMFP